MGVEITVRTGMDDGGARRSPTDNSASSRWWSRPVNDEPEPAKESKAEGDDEEAEEREYVAPSERPPPPAVHGAIVGYVQRLMRAWSRHDIFDRLFDRAYENRTLRTNHYGLAAMSAAGYSVGRLAVTTSVVDTFVSRFAKRRPQPMIVVDEAEWLNKQRAIEYRRFLDGKMRETEVDRLSDIVLGDACRRGTGILYIDDGEDDVCVEQVNRWEIYVDPHEARGGESSVRQMHRVRRVAREVLCEQYPDNYAQIMSAPPSKMRPGETGTEEWTCPAGFYDKADVIDVYESWHLPSGKHSDDGRRARCLEGATLCYERYDCDRFPFAILRRHLRPNPAFWGQGDVERIAPLQHDINLIARDLQQNIEVGGKLYLMTGGAADQLPTEKLVGVKPMRIRGALPGQVQFVPPTAVSMAHQQILDSRIEYAYRLSGVADWAATARSPVGAGASGVAIDTMEDLQSDRHASFEGRYSHWRCDIAQLILNAAARVAERMRAQVKADGKRIDYAACWMEAGTLRRIAYDDVKLEPDSYRVQIESASYLPTTRAGKLAALKELTAAGYIPQWAAAASFEEPDLAHTNRIVLAKYHNSERMMQIIGDPTQEMPVVEPFHDKDLLIAFGVAYYNRAQCDRAPDEVLLRYATLIDQAIEAKQNAQGPSPGGAEIPSPALAPPDTIGAPGGMAGMTPPGAGLPPGSVPGGAPPMMAPMPMGGGMAPMGPQ